MGESACPHFSSGKPKCHCLPCWTQYFVDHQHVYMIITAAEKARTKERMEAILGAKLYKMYRRVKAAREELER